MAVQRQPEEGKCNLRLESEVRSQFLIIFTMQTSSTLLISDRYEQTCCMVGACKRHSALPHP